MGQGHSQGRHGLVDQRGSALHMHAQDQVPTQARMQCRGPRAACEWQASFEQQSACLQSSRGLSADPSRPLQSKSLWELEPAPLAITQITSYIPSAIWHAKTTTNTEGTATLAETVDSQATLHRLYTKYMIQRTGDNNNTYTACDPRLGYSCIPPACAQTDTIPKALLHNHSSPTVTLPAKMGPLVADFFDTSSYYDASPAPASPMHTERARPGY